MAVKSLIGVSRYAAVVRNVVAGDGVFLRRRLGKRRSDGDEKGSVRSHEFVVCRGCFFFCGQMRGARSLCPVDHGKVHVSLSPPGGSAEIIPRGTLSRPLQTIRTNTSGPGLEKWVSLPKKNFRGGTHGENSLYYK